ncbi:hypothetical protein DAPPUDRAFT_271603 [Daphnia pulex]|uniref:S1 motif domain-containing protein n=1 Tax=Daphnia pulex TaxID=6669 RepID=E9I2A5_DAPPU|nr:hypothetical protein DAPPUDRAFT_271603 [Daphnia pulex]|eukprot:EFX61875.1 hypothetical protein DAPPUDRAFT_271603 [Daphnia pulex]
MSSIPDNFTDWINVRIHLDKDGFGTCSGQAIGVQIRLGNGLTGFLPIKCLSDPEVKTPEERFRPGQTIHCRITRIDVENFSVEATVPVQAPIPLPSAPSTSSRPNSSDGSRSPLPRAHSPISPTPVPAWYQNLVAAQPSIFEGNPVLWETQVILFSI